MISKNKTNATGTDYLPLTLILISLQTGGVHFVWFCLDSLVSRCIPEDNEHDEDGEWVLLRGSFDGNYDDAHL